MCRFIESSLIWEMIKAALLMADGGWAIATTHDADSQR